MNIIRSDMKALMQHKRHHDSTIINSGLTSQNNHEYYDRVVEPIVITSTALSVMYSDLSRCTHTKQNNLNDWV